MIDIATLTKKRKKYVESARENNFEEGLLKLLTELYPDNAHFIYELLQNAEDTKATKILFELYDDQLVFYHNGKRDFDYDDIESITNIGHSTKKDDINQIGKFGVGFKAVFSYTSMPEIHSREVSFRIKDLFIPETIPPAAVKDPYTTMMIFPFNHKEKTAQKANAEIEYHLENLSDETLLFLTHIDEIAWQIDGKILSIKRIEKTQSHIEILNTRNETSSKWLKYTKKVPHKDGLYVAIAFKLGEDENTDKIKIVPVEGKVSIFFPAEKETSKLKFHIHAPFASTVARDSIKDLGENKELIGLIAEVTAESLLDIKKKRLLTTDFLEVLPIPDDELTSFYMPIQIKLDEVFHQEALLPTDSGAYARATQCFFAPADIRRVLNRQDLMLLLESEDDIYFAKSAKQLNSRADKYIRSLRLKSFNWEEFAEAIGKLSEDITDDNREFWEDDYGELEKIDAKREWLEKKENGWLQKFYALLWDAYDRSDCYEIESVSSLIKLSDGGFNYANNDLYFLDENNRIAEFIYVEPLTYTSGKNKRQQEKAKNFLELNGVKQITEKELIELTLKKYYSGADFNPPKDFDTHVTHINKFIAFAKEYEDFSFMKNYYFIRCVDESKGNQTYCRPEGVYIDDPYENTSLTCIKEYLDEYPIDPIYVGYINKSDFIWFLKKLRTQDSIHIKKVPIWDNLDEHKLTEGTMGNKVTNYQVNKDFSIKNLDEMLSHINLERAKLLWKTMSDADPDVLKASYSPNKKVHIRTADSQLVHLLKKYAWVPDKNGNFHKPCDIDREMLHPSIQYDDRNGWLKAIEFGEKVKKKTKEHQKKEAVVKELGLGSIEELEKLKELKAVLSPEEIEQLIKSKKKKQTEDKKSLQEALESNNAGGDTSPVEPAINSETIIKDLGKHSHNIHEENTNSTNTFTSTTHHVTKQESEEIEKIRNFLYREYEGHCQICGDTFAYKGKNYFKLKSLNTGKSRDVSRKGNTLCLCPKHWEIFDKKLINFKFLENIKDTNPLSIDTIDKQFKTYGLVGKDDIDEDNDAFYMLDERDDFMRDDVYFLPIRMFDKIYYLKFTKAHMMEFVEVWNNN